MISVLKRVFLFIIDLLGFKRNPRRVTKYLNDANVKSSIYMTFIVIGIEIWMIIRQINSYISPAWNTTDNNFKLFFSYTSFYLLFIVTSIAVLIFALTYIKGGKLSKFLLIVNIVVSALCILWAPFISLETLKFDSTIYAYDSICVIGLYAMQPILGLTILGHSIYHLKTGHTNYIIAIGVMICFAAVCLLFGFKVGYSDFASLDRKVGANYTAENIYKRFDRIKMITCFLTMILFAGCLLIWKPYISLILLISIFSLFIATLENTGLNRPFVEGDKINLITFLIALSVISISIYRQRLADALNEIKLEHAAIFDPLVDIHNLQYFDTTVKERKAENNNYCDDKICLFLNLVNFRTINDQKSFEAGNEFLKDFGKCVEEAFKDDIVSRQADDHFIVMTSQTGFMDKINILSSLLIDLSNGIFLQLKVGGYRPNQNEEPTRAIDKARYACGSIKNKFGVIFCEYDEKMDEGFRKKQYIINNLEEAIKNDWIKAFYQPLVDTKTKNLIGAEALARWIDPNYGFLSPGDFIPILEDTRLIHKLDAHIIDYVCRNMRGAIDRGRKVVPVSINFSRLDFELMDIVKLLDDILEKYNLNKHYLHVEITESALTDDLGGLNKTIDILREKGYQIWLDDFGSGYSSLNVLKDFEFNVVKIDMKFLSNIDNQRSKDILDSIIKLSKKLGMKTLTEGVETKVQSDFLNEIGCDYLQGYLYGKPHKLEEFEDRIDKGELVIPDDIFDKVSE